MIQTIITVLLFLTLGSLELWQAIDETTDQVEKVVILLPCIANYVVSCLLVIKQTKKQEFGTQSGTQTSTKSGTRSGTISRVSAKSGNRVWKCVWIISILLQFFSGLGTLVLLIYESPSPSVFMILLLLESILFCIRTIIGLFHIINLVANSICCQTP